MHRVLGLSASSAHTVPRAPEAGSATSRNWDMLASGRSAAGPRPGDLLHPNHGALDLLVRALQTYSAYPPGRLRWWAPMQLPKHRSPSMSSARLPNVPCVIGAALPGPCHPATCTSPCMWRCLSSAILCSMRSPCTLLLGHLRLSSPSFPTRPSNPAVRSPRRPPDQLQSLVADGLLDTLLNLELEFFHHRCHRCGGV